MTEQAEVRALAELDGFQVEQLAGNTLKLHTPAGGSVIGRSDLLEAMFQQASVPDYLHSYDAILPLVQKHLEADSTYPRTSTFFDKLDMLDPGCFEDMSYLQATPQQLCHALLQATGRWTE